MRFHMHSSACAVSGESYAAIVAAGGGSFVRAMWGRGRAESRPDVEARADRSIAWI